MDLDDDHAERPPADAGSLRFPGIVALRGENLRVRGLHRDDISGCGGLKGTAAYSDS